jgi:hypothetical protein
MNAITKGDADVTITHRLKMNLEGGDILQRLEMPLGDASTRKIELLLYENQKIWIIPEDIAVVIRYKKPDGTMGEYDTLPDGSAAWSALDNMLTLTLAPQVLSTAGNVVLYAAVYQEDKVLQTFAMEIFVKAPFGGSKAIVSQDYSYMTNVLRGPVMAQEGQVLAVGSVDAYGRVKEVEVLDPAALVNENGSAVLHKAQNLTINQKFQARRNIDAASQVSVDFLTSKFAPNGIYLVDEKTAEKYVLYVKKGKLMMEKE